MYTNVQCVCTILKFHNPVAIERERDMQNESKFFSGDQVGIVVRESFLRVSTN